VLLKEWNSRRLVHGKEMVWAALGHVLIGRMQWTCLWMFAECRWSKDADPLSSNVCGHAQNRLWARQYWRYVPPSFPGPNPQQMVIGRFSVGPVGLSVFSPEISEITGFGWYIHASDFPPNSQTWWDLEPAKMGSKCFVLKVMYWKVIVFFGGGPYRFTAFRSCPMSCSTPPY